MKKRIAATLLLLAMLFGVMAPFTAFAGEDEEAPLPRAINYEAKAGGKCRLVMDYNSKYAKKVTGVELKRNEQKISFEKAEQIDDLKFIVNTFPGGITIQVEQQFNFKAGDIITITSRGYKQKSFVLKERTSPANPNVPFEEVKPSEPAPLDFDIDSDSLPNGELKGKFGEALKKEISLTGTDKDSAEFKKVSIKKNGEEVPAADLGLAIKMEEQKVTVTGTPNAKATEDGFELYMEADVKDSSKPSQKKEKTFKLSVQSEYKITEIMPTAMTKGEEKILHAKVTKNNMDFASSEYETIWSITSSGHADGTAIAGDKLTVAAAEPKNEITVKAVCQAGGQPIAEKEQRITLHQAASPQTYPVTLTPGTGYTLAAKEGSNSPVEEGGNFSFTVTIASGYHKGTDFKVKVGAEVLAENPAGSGVYTIKDIKEAKTVTVEGVLADAQVSPEDVKAAKEKLKTYVDSIKLLVLGMPGIDTASNQAAIAEFKAHHKKADELLKKDNAEITPEELNSMKKMPSYMEGGKKIKGTFSEIVKKMRADFEVVGARTEKTRITETLIRY